MTSYEVREGRGEYLPRLWTDKPVKLGERIQSRKEREEKVESLTVDSHRK